MGTSTMDNSKKPYAINDIINESINMIVSLNDNLNTENSVTVLEKTVKFNDDYFINLVNFDDWTPDENFIVISRK